MTFLRYLVVAFLAVGTSYGNPAKKPPRWTDYEADFMVQNGDQPVVILRWWSMDSKGPCQEYPQIWRKGMKFGLGDRFLVTSLTGVDHDGMKKKGVVVVAVIEDTITNKKITFRSDGSRYSRSFSKDWMRKHAEKFPPKEPEPEKSK